MMSLFPRLFLIDGSALVYRSHFALAKSALTNSKGEPTGAVFGSLNQLIALLEREDPDRIAVVFDASGPTFRHQMFAEYKATREKMPDELRHQLPIVKDVLRAMGLPVLEQMGVEADDIIGTLATWGAQQGWEVMIVSGDKDFAQLVGSNIYLYDPGKRGSGPSILGTAEVQEKFGVSPKQIVDYFALIGDSSDNVPGVPKVGPKTAASWLHTYGSLDQIYANLDDIKGNLQQQLRDYKQQAELSKQLVTIACDVDVPLDLATVSRKTPDHATLARILLELEFTKLLDKLVKPEDIAALSRQVTYVSIESTTQLQQLQQEILASQEVALAALHVYEQPMPQCLGLSFATQPHKAYYLSLTEDATIPPETALSTIHEILINPDIRKVGHDLKEVYIALANHGVLLEGIAFDTMLASHLLAGVRLDHDLDVIALQHLGIRKASEKDILGTGRHKRSWLQTDEETRCQYLCDEVDLALQVTQSLRPRLETKERRHQLLFEFDLPLIPVLACMERWGIAVDLEKLQDIRKQTLQYMDQIKQQIDPWANDPEFNVLSPQQVGTLLFDKLMLHEQLGVKAKKTEKTGAYVTDQEVLEELSTHELPRLILQYRELHKRLSTYIDPLLELSVPDAQDVPRIHTRFRQTGTITGRLSSFSPNLQNIPTRTEEGREIRRTFVAGNPNWVLVSADYSQIELRILAHISGDPGLREAFQQGIDIHAQTAGLLFGVFPSFVTPEQRHAAKAINFGIAYGMGPPRLAQQINVTVNEAGRFIKAYFAAYPKVKEYLNQTIEFARNYRYVETMFGRRREIYDINSTDARTRAHNENMAVNTPIQGTAADLIKLAMIRIHQQLQSETWQTRMLLQIHDELLFETPPSELDRLIPMIQHEMRNAIQLDVPLVVDVGWGQNWADTK